MHIEEEKGENETSEDYAVRTARESGEGSKRQLEKILNDMRIQSRLMMLVIAIGLFNLVVDYCEFRYACPQCRRPA